MVMEYSIYNTPLKQAIQNIIFTKMFPFPNYRISLKKNPSSKTLTNFPCLNRLKKQNSNLKKQKLSQQQKQERQQKQNSEQNMKNITLTEKLVNQHKKNYSKTFAFDSSDKYIKKILLANEWKLIPSEQKLTKLKWISIAKNHHFSNLQNSQLINHFKDSYKLTTKLGLYNMLSNPLNQTLTNFQGQNYLTIYPRSYDLGAEFDSFIKDFSHTAILNLMKKLMIHIQIQHQNTFYKTYKKLSQKQIQVNKDPENLKNRIQELLSNQNKIFEEQNFAKNNLSKCQRIMVNKFMFIYLLNYFWANFQGKIIPSSKLQFLQNYSKLNPPFKDFEEHFFNNEKQIGFLTHQTGILFFNIYFYCLDNYKYFLNDGLNNMWIVKANQSSRGRNIFLVNSVEEIQNYRNGGSRLIQKYIENVWILNSPNGCNQESRNHSIISKLFNRKFDIRFWVLVKSFLPFEAYIFNQGYLRLSSQSYNFSENRSSIKAHLTNYSLNYHKQNKIAQSQNSYVLFSDFVNFLLSQRLIDQKDNLFLKIKSKIYYVLQCASMNWRFNQTDKNSFQLFGFDIILDSNMQPFILQCNMSPACHQRGQLKQLAQKMGQQMFQILGIINKKCENQFNFQNEQKGPKWVQFFSKQFKQNNSCLFFGLKSLFTQNRKKINNVEGIQIVGQAIKRQFAIQDYYLNFIDKIIYLQRFFSRRYNNFSSHATYSTSKICKMIQNLSKISKNRNMKLIKKLFKQIKKYGIKKINYKRQKSFNNANFALRND